MGMVVVRAIARASVVCLLISGRMAEGRDNS